MELPPASIIIAQIIVLFFGIGLHEYAHCKFADMAGDPTPRYYGRVTLNLTKHFEPMGTLFMLFTLLSGFGIGWGRPAPMNASKMRNPRWDLFAAVAAGPLTNLIQAIIYGGLTRVLLQRLNPADPVQEVAAFVLIFGVLINLGLFLFNLIPFGPLDGHWLVGLLLPERARLKWFMFNRRVGFAGLFLLIIVLNFSRVSLMAGPITYGFQVLTGVQLSHLLR